MLLLHSPYLRCKQALRCKQEEVKLLANVLQDKLGLKCSIYSINRIYIWASSTEQLANIARPYVPNSMAYKIN